MMPRVYCLIGCIALIALIVAPAGAGVLPPRGMGMGNTRIGVDFSPWAWNGNAALLPLTNNVPPVFSGWQHSAEFSAALGSGVVSNVQMFGVGGHNADSTLGFGAGYANFGGHSDVYGAGAGCALGIEGLTGGLGITVFDGFGPAEVVFSPGFAYQQPMHGADMTYGAVVRDVTDRMGTALDLGVSATWPSGVTVAVDYLDVTDRSIFNFGAEYDWEVFALRAGLADGDLTVGLGYSFSETVQVSLAYQDWGWTSAYFGGALISF